MTRWPPPVDMATVAAVSHRVWTAEELEAMTPAEQDVIFRNSIVSDLSTVPQKFLSRVQRRVQLRISPSPGAV